MSIVIKGMKMPKNCKTCGFVVCDDEYSPEYWCPIVRDGVNNYVHCRHKLCPLVEIPPHGRLIDADKIQEHIKENISLAEEALTCDLTSNAKLQIRDYEEMDNLFLEQLDDAPTVLESEEQENDTESEER